MRKFWYLLLLYLYPTKFVKVSVNKRGYGNKEEKKEVSNQELKKAREIRRSHLKVFLLISVICLLGFLLADYLNSTVVITISQIRALRLVSIIVVAWIVLSKLTWKIQSWSGDSLPEKINNFSFWFFYSLGIFIAVLSLFLEPE